MPAFVMNISNAVEPVVNTETTESMSARSSERTGTRYRQLCS